MSGVITTAALGYYHSQMNAPENISIYGSSLAFTVASA
jgi:hypothetical protein